MADFNPYALHSKQPEHPLWSPSSLVGEGTPTKETPVDDSSDAMDAARRRRPTWKIILPTIAVVVLTAGLAVLLLTYVLVMHAWNVSPNHRVLNTSADPQRVLTISQVLTTVVSKSVPVVVSVYAYRLAASWLDANRPDARAVDQPSPLQYGVILSILEGANLLAWAKAKLYIAGVGARQNLRQPSILKRAVWVLGILLFLSNAITVFDTWFHATTASRLFTQTATYDATAPRSFGLAINSTNCQENSLASSAARAVTCGLVTGGSIGSLPAESVGLRTLTNSSDSTRVAYTDDQHAILVPSLVPPNATYVASTYGIQASCESITHHCIYPNSEGTYTGPQVAPDMNCIGSPTVSLNSTLIGSGARPFGVLSEPNGTIEDTTPYNYIQTNPFPLVAVISSMAYSHVGATSASADDPFVNNTGFFSWGNNGAWNIIYCNVSTHSIQYQYQSALDNAYGSYITLSFTPTPVNTTVFLGSMLASSLISQNVPSAVDGIGIQSGDYVESFALELSRELMGLSTMIFIPTEVVSISSVNVSVGAAIQIPALVCYLGFVGVYALATLSIGFLAIRSASGRPFVGLAQMRLTSPLPIIGT